MRKFLSIFTYIVAIAFTLAIVIFMKYGAHPPVNAHEIRHWQEPIQKNLPGTYGKKFKYGHLRYMAEFEISGRVLGKKNYNDGRYGEISPMDLSLGWKYMSEPEIYNRLKTENHNRWFYWTGSLRIPEKDSLYSFANIHIIPANKKILKKLRSLKKSDLVRLKGYLVDYDERGNFHTFSLKTSLSRKDTGESSCELLYVNYIEKY